MTIATYTAHVAIANDLADNPAMRDLFVWLFVIPAIATLAGYHIVYFQQMLGCFPECEPHRQQPQGWKAIVLSDTSYLALCSIGAVMSSVCLCDRLLLPREIQLSEFFNFKVLLAGMMYVGFSVMPILYRRVTLIELKNIRSRLRSQAAE